MSIDNILNKYKINKSKNDAFLGLWGYDPNEIDKDISDFSSEYDKQLMTSEKFNESGDILEKCKSFSSNYSEKIEHQAKELAILAKELPNIIKKNKENAEINEEMNELINTEHYKELTSKLRAIKTNILLKNF